jgi:hypothetical protein
LGAQPAHEIRPNGQQPCLWYAHHCYLHSPCT